MKNIFRMLSLAAVFLVSGAAQAAKLPMTWMPRLENTSTGYLTIDFYRYFWDGDTLGLMVVFKPEGWINTGCNVSDFYKILTHTSLEWSSNDFVQGLQASVISAAAQGQKVAVMYHTGTCDPAYGARLLGIQPAPGITQP